MDPEIYIRDRVNQILNTPNKRYSIQDEAKGLMRVYKKENGKIINFHNAAAEIDEAMRIEMNKSSR
jgi:hypothetical protein